MRPKMEIKMEPVGNGETSQTRAIQQAIDRLSASGGGRVVLGPGMYVCGTLRLEDGVTLWLEDGAALLGSDAIEDYPDNETCFTDAVGHVRGKALIYAYQKQDIGIGGPGMVNGRGYLYPVDHPAHRIRPFLVRLVECSRVTVEDTSFINAAAWCLHFQDCREVTVCRVTIHSRCNGNNDGIDLDGCQQVLVEDCSIDSGDDAICLKSTSGSACRAIQVRGCTVTSHCGGFKIGTESVGDFSDITLEQCRFFDVEGGAVKILPVDGGNVACVLIRDVEMISCTGPVFISNGTRLRRYLNVQREKPGTIEDIVLEHVRADVKPAPVSWYQGKVWANAEGGVVLSGLPQNPIRRVTIRNCRFHMPGGRDEQPTGPVPVMGDQYPEFHLFDPLPAWGMYERDTEDTELIDTVFTKRAPDVRPVRVKEENEERKDAG